MTDDPSSPPAPGRPRPQRRRRTSGADVLSAASPADLWRAFPDQVFEIDPDERILFANHGLHGVPLDRIRGNPLSSLLPVEHRRAFREACRLARETAAEHSFETATLHPPWWRYRVVPIAGRSGKQARLLVVRTDITSQRESSRGAIEESDHQRLAFEAAKTGMAVTGVDGSFLLVNRALCELLGYTREELLDTDIYAVTHPDDLAESAIQARRLLMGTSDNEVVEKRYFHRDGHVVWCRVCATAAADDDGVTRYLVTQVQDIGRLKAARSNRQRHNRQATEAGRLDALQDLAGRVAAEFDPMMEQVASLVSRLEESVPADNRAYEALQAVRDSLERRREFVGQLLTMSRRQALERESLAINGFLTDLGARLEVEGDGHGCFRLALGSSIPPVSADPGQLEVAVRALVTNAQEAMPAGGEVLIETRVIRLDRAHCSEYPGLRTGDYVLLTVSDTGTGMDRGTLGHLFDPFFTTRSPTAHRGLGLPTALGIARQHGGLLTVYSEVGRGTSCKMFLPTEDAGHLPARAAPGAQGQETILLAEDEEALASVAQRILERLGYRVLLAVDGVEALHMFVASRGQIDLVLLDLAMPRMGGMDAYDRIRTLDRTVPIGFMSGYSAEMAVDSVAHSGAVLIPKPYGIEELGEKVRAMLDRAPREGPTDGS